MAQERNTHDILILQKSDALPQGLREYLQTKGFESQVITELEEIKLGLKPLSDPIILVDCGKNEELGFSLVKSLIDDHTLHSIPLIVIGEDMDGYEGVLGRYYKLATTINNPCTSAEIYEAVNYVAKLYEKSKATKKDPSASPVKQHLDETEECSEAVAELTHQLFTQIDEIPVLIFEQLKALRLMERRLNGALYTGKFAEEILELPPYQIKDKKVAKVTTTILEDAGKWGKAHLQRSLFIGTHLLSCLPISDDLKEKAKQAGMLSAWAFADKDRGLMRGDYLNQRALLVRKDLCSKVKDSAMKVAIDLSQPEIGNIVATLGRQIGGEEAPSDEPISIAASAIMAADLIDRVCYEQQHWSSRAAYSLLRKIKSGKIKAIHPAVLGCMIKFLSEAISAAPSVIVLPRGVARNKRLRENAAQIKNQEIGKDERKIPISSLQPGMRISRPIFSFDGKQVLGCDLVLDQDLIWRIWQLAALRPLNGPVVIKIEENAVAH